MAESFYPISYAEGIKVFNEAMVRFSDFYRMQLTDVLVYAKCLIPEEFESEIQKYAALHGVSPDKTEAMSENSRGITLPVDGRFIVLVKYEEDECDTTEDIRETTYHELGHALSLYQTNQRHPDRENVLQNPKDINTETWLNTGDYIWQEFIAKYLAAHLITADNLRMAFDKRNRADIFAELIEAFRMHLDHYTCYDKLIDVFAIALNSSIPFSEYIMPTDCGDELPQLIKKLYDILYQHCTMNADYTADAKFTEEIGHYALTSLIEARKYPLTLEELY